jgi:osmotically-inducible protein OsmY
MINKEIVRQLRATLERDPRIKSHRYPITIATQNGDLILSGDVESVAAKKLALLAAAEVHGVQRIVDRLKVMPSEKMEDAELRDHVCRVLLEEPAFEQYIIHGFAGVSVEVARKSRLEPTPSINVEVANGVVTLNGQVSSLSHKRLAGVLAWWVPGTRDVINGLEEVPPEQDNDDELIDAVRLVLEKDPFVNASKIHVSCKDWVVTLGGLVPTETMREMAEQDTWYVLGIKTVINKIAVKP